MALKAVVHGFDAVITKKKVDYLKNTFNKTWNNFFLKSFGPRYDIYLKDIKNYGHRLTGLDEEGLQVFDNSWIIGKKDFQKMFLIIMSCIFFRGVIVQKIFISHLSKKWKKKSKLFQADIY